MRSNKFVFGIFSFLSLFFLNTCKDVDGLSRDAEVLDFRIVSYYPDGNILIGTPEIGNDTIFVPLLYGKYFFPLTINVEASFSPSKDKVIGEYNRFVFKYNQNGDVTVNDNLGAATFYVVSQSGFTKRWYVALKELSNSDDASIRSFVLKENKPDNALLCRNGLVDNIDTTVSLYYIDATFPLKVAPEIVLADGARFPKDYDDTLRFSSASKIIGLKIVSSSGKEKNWNISTKKATVVSDISSLPFAERSRLALDKAEFELSVSNPGGSRVVKTDIDNGNGTIVVSISNLSRIEFPLRLQMKYGELPNKQVAGVLSGQEWVFSSKNDSKDFYVFDEIKKKAYKWTVRLQEAEEGVADIYDMVIRQVISPSGLLQIEPSVSVNESDHTVLVRLPSSARAFPLTINVGEWRLSDGAEISNWENPLVFTAETKILTIANGTVRQEWKIQLDFPELRDGANVVSSGINRISGGNKLAEEPVRIDSTEDVVRILLEEFSFPFVFEPELEFSPGAVSEDVASGQLLEFSSWEDVISFQVRAENGRLKQWKIMLVDAPQLKNTDFAEWGPDGNPLYWATANNSVVTGTTPANIGVDKTGVMLTTKKNQSIVKAIAAGSVFLGKFTFKISDFNQPKKMTNFGIPFTAKPVAIEVDVSYAPGPVLERLDKEKDQFVVVSGDQDRGIVWVELLYWDGNGEYEYHGKNMATTVVLLGRGEKEFGNTNGWQYKVRIPIQYIDQYTRPTHIAVTMSSGSRGDDFIGAVGSKLMARNVKLIY